MQPLQASHIAERLEQLTELAVALGGRDDIDTLLERILLVAKRMTGVDGGTLYRPAADKASLRFHISLNDTLCIHQGGTSGNPVGIADVPLFDADGAQNLASVAAFAANLRQSVNIADVYDAGVFNFSAMRAFDAAFAYRTTSVLTVPMSDNEDELIGVLQLINAPEESATAVSGFSDTDQRFIEALASQAGVAITREQLVGQLEALLEGLVKLINLGIDEKSPYTGRHCQFVPQLTMMLAEAVHASAHGPLAGFRLTDADRKELWMAGLLHDCGKITTPVHVVDKATKLEIIHDCIHLVDTRFEVLLRDAAILALQDKLAGGEHAAIDARLAEARAPCCWTNGIFCGAPTWAANR